MGKSSVSIAKEIMKNSGVPGFWRGTVASLYRQVPGIAMFYGVLEKLQPKTASERIGAGCLARLRGGNLCNDLKVRKKHNFL